jgi:hypothetical protein
MLISHLGLQNDEALFAGALFSPKTGNIVRIGHSRLPVMLMSYLGTLKSLIYRPVFALWGTGIRATRVPMLLAGAASIWFFFLLLRRAAGYRAASFACGLLAADTVYLLTICFDWGPVALQHMLLLGGFLLLVGFYQTRQVSRLFWGWFVLGLGMWDKALMIWMLGGLFMGVMSVYGRKILAVITVRLTAISALGFIVGALPLIAYNVDNHFATFRSNTSYDGSDLPGKARQLRSTAEGRVLFGWLVNEDWQTASPHAPSDLSETVSAKVSAFTGRPRQHLLPYAFVAALLLIPLAGASARRVLLCALIALVVAWLQMAFTANAGGSAHHAILLWPLPEAVVAVSFAAASRKLGRAGIPALAVALTLMMTCGFLVTNEYYFLMIRNGGAQNWTTAIFKLSDYMKGTSPAQVYCVDWGIMDSLRLLNRGRLPLRVGNDLVSKAGADPGVRDALMKTLAKPDAWFIGHTKDFEFFQGTDERLVRYAADAGYERAILATIPDSYGRPVYEVYHFVARRDSQH